MVTAASAIVPGHREVAGFPAVGLDPFTDFFLNQAGRTPGHDYDHDCESEHILVGAREWEQHSAHRLQSGEQEAAEDSPIDAAKATDNRRGKANHAEI